jgi:hypothetical protein
LDATERYILSETEVFESCFDEKGKLFRGMQKEHGRCVGKVYVDKKSGDEGELIARQIGWVFQKLENYQDSNEKFLRETWVTIHREPAQKVIHYHYQYIDDEPVKLVQKINNLK